MKSKKRYDSEEDRIIWSLEDGTLHRVNGPAVIFSDGTKYWYVCGSVIYMRPTS